MTKVIAGSKAPPPGADSLQAKAAAKLDQKFHFKRHGYFVADRADHGVGGKVVFNRVTGLKDSWAK